MVVFGAGASFDLDRRYPAQAGSPPSDARLPLAKNLFDPAYGRFAARYPACKALLAPMRKAGGAIESQFERLRDELGKHPHIANQLAAARYYLRDLITDAQDRWKVSEPDETSNYVDLFDAIERWRGPRNEQVCLVTFNYDTLLEEACTSVLPNRLRFETVNSYLGDSYVTVYKLHGSTDWYEELSVYRSAARDATSQGEVEQWLIQMAGPNSERTGRFFKFDEAPTVAGKWLGTSVSIPTATKTDTAFSCPREHLEVLVRHMPYVTHLLVIGWRGQEAHFHRLWNDATGRSHGPLNMRLTKTLVVDGDKATGHEVLEALDQTMGIGGRPLAAFEGGFSAFVDSDRLTEFLTG